MAKLAGGLRLPLRVLGRGCKAAGLPPGQRLGCLCISFALHLSVICCMDYMADSKLLEEK